MHAYGFLLAVMDLTDWHFSINVKSSLNNIISSSRRSPAIASQHAARSSLHSVAKSEIPLAQTRPKYYSMMMGFYSRASTIRTNDVIQRRSNINTKVLIG